MAVKHKAVYMVGFAALSGILLGASVLIGSLDRSFISDVKADKNAAVIASAPAVVLDPGHGGIDGGAESADGECEKNINLNICFKVRDILDKNGVRVVMTRESDCGLYSDGKSSIRAKKTEDLRARLDMSYKLKPDAFVSVHLNSYREDRSVFGAQVFYTAEGDEAVCEMSRVLAEKIQALLVSYIENGNTRTAMAKGDVLLMKEARYPTVIVECGFLSNAAECERLCDPVYQKQLAFTIFKAICESVNAESAETNVSFK